MGCTQSTGCSRPAVARKPRRSSSDADSDAMTSELASNSSMSTLKGCAAFPAICVTFVDFKASGCGIGPQNARYLTVPGQWWTEEDEEASETDGSEECNMIEGNDIDDDLRSIDSDELGDTYGASTTSDLFYSGSLFNCSDFTDEELSQRRASAGALKAYLSTPPAPATTVDVRRTSL